MKAAVRITIAVAVFLSVFLEGFVCQINFIREPDNTYHILSHSDPLFLNCTINGLPELQQTSWTEYITSGAGAQISVDQNVARSYDEDFDIEGEYNLVFITQELNYAGQYSCGQTGAPFEQRFAEVVILESDPVCSTNINGSTVVEGDVLTLECTVTYSGRWAPRMTWRDRVDNVIPSTNLTVAGTVRYAIEITVVETVIPIAYSCLTDFETLEAEDVGTDEADNSLMYQYSYSTGDITVHYSPRETVITPSDDVMYVGQELRCEARANPPIDAAEWFLSDVAIADEGGLTFMIPSDWLGQNVTLSCQSYNSIGSEMSEDISFTVAQTTTPPTTTPAPTTTTEASTQDSNSVSPAGSDGGGGDGGGSDGLATGAIAGIVVVVIVVIIVVVVVIYCVIKRRPPSAASEKQVEAARPPPKSAMRNPDLVRAPPAGGLDTSYHSGHLPPHQSQPAAPYSGQTSPLSTLQRGGGVGGQPPPPYNGDTSYDSGYDPYGTDSRKRNFENIPYDMALDDTPRSRKPIQVYEQTDYADMQRV